MKECSNLNFTTPHHVCNMYISSDMPQLDHIGSLIIQGSRNLPCAPSLFAAICTKGHVFESCFDGCPHNPDCGERRYGCDPVLHMCEHKCICPEEKPYKNDDGECVALRDCVSKYNQRLKNNTVLLNSLSIFWNHVTGTVLCDELSHTNFTTFVHKY